MLRLRDGAIRVLHVPVPPFLHLTKGQAVVLTLKVTVRLGKLMPVRHQEQYVTHGICSINATFFI